MNKQRRQAIRTLIKQLRAPNPDREAILEELRDLLYEEEDVRDNYPESLQDTDAYNTMDESCDYLEEAIDELEAMEEDDEDYDGVVDILASIDGV